MKTFFQFVEAKLFNQYAQDHEVSIDGIEEVVSQLTHEQQVEFALYCAKDCIHLSDESAKSEAEKCIKLVEDWLYSENKPNRNQLISAASSIYNFRMTRFSNNYNPISDNCLNSVYFVVETAAASGSFFSNAAHYAASAFAANNVYDVSVDASDSDFESARTKKMQQYLNVAKSYLISSDFKPDVPFFNKKEVDKFDLHGFLDYIEDNQMEIFDKDNEGNVVLDLAGYRLVAKDIHEMIDKISKDVNVINQLRRMFKV